MFQHNRSSSVLPARSHEHDPSQLPLNNIHSHSFFHISIIYHFRHVVSLSYHRSPQQIFSFLSDSFTYLPSPHLCRRDLHIFQLQPNLSSSIVNYLFPHKRLKVFFFVYFYQLKICSNCLRVPSASKRINRICEHFAAKI